MAGISRLIKGALLVSAITLATTACGQKGVMLGSSDAPQPTATAAVQESRSPQPTAAPDPLKQKQVKLYYSDENELKLVEKAASISYKNEDELYASSLKALTKSDDPKAVSLFEDMEFKKISFNKEKGELTVDLTFGPNSQLGAPGEELCLEALKKTSFQFPEVKALYVLKDGKQVDSLMGHMELPYPIKRPN